MLPNNNLSVLPWYSSPDQQNARRWWVYGREYPLYAPSTSLLPFQILRNQNRTYIPGSEIAVDETDRGRIALDGSWMQDTPVGYYVAQFLIDDTVHYVYLDGIAKPPQLSVPVAFYNDNYDLIKTETIDFGEETLIAKGFAVPSGAVWMRVQQTNPDTPISSLIVYEATISPAPVQLFEIYDKNGSLVQSLNPQDLGFSIKSFDQFKYDVIIFPGQLPLLNMPIGQYYAKLSDGVDTWYSEVFTSVVDMSPYLKIEWWDEKDFVMDAGTIVYQYAGTTQFKNILYLNSDIAKPEYDFEEEGDERGGYYFPIYQISSKKYRFEFLASEYLLDVMRFIRLADFAEIYKNGRRYSLDTFLITPAWEGEGDIATVEAEFTSATVAKKIGTGYIKAQRGDFNDDFNNDFNNQ